MAFAHQVQPGPLAGIHHETPGPAKVSQMPVGGAALPSPSSAAERAAEDNLWLPSNTDAADVV